MTRPRMKLGPQQVRIVELADKGLTRPEIAVALGVSYGFVQNAVKRLRRRGLNLEVASAVGIKTPPPAGPVKPPKPVEMIRYVRWHGLIWYGTGGRGRISVTTDDREHTERMCASLGDRRSDARVRRIYAVEYSRAGANGVWEERVITTKEGANR